MERTPIMEQVFAHYGGPSALAKYLNLSRQAVWQWKVVPLKYLTLISQQTKITRRKLRPDLYA